MIDEAVDDYTNVRTVHYYTLSKFRCGAITVRKSS